MKCLLPLEAVTRLCSRILTLNKPLKCLDFWKIIKVENSLPSGCIISMLHTGLLFNGILTKRSFAEKCSFTLFSFGVATASFSAFKMIIQFLETQWGKTKAKIQRWHLKNGWCSYSKMKIWQLWYIWPKALKQTKWTILENIRVG